MRFRSVFGVCAGTGVLLAAHVSSVHAYCRTTTSERVAGDCPDVCITEGLPLYWPKSELRYVFNRRGFPGLDDTTLRELIAESFEPWQAVSCEDPDTGEQVSVGLNIRAERGETDLEVGPEEAEPNPSVIVHYDSQRWAEEDLPEQAFALTAIWFNKNNGEILGADMHFNGGMDPFGECPEQGCSGGIRMTDLRNVTTHEAGHFLGLAHSDVDGATMWCDADAGDVDKRSLEEDDIAGLCAIYPPGRPIDNPSPARADTCGLSARGEPSGAWWPWALLAGLCLRRRGRAPAKP